MVKNSTHFIPLFPDRIYRNTFRLFRNVKILANVLLIGGMIFKPFLNPTKNIERFPFLPVLRKTEKKQKKYETPIYSLNCKP